MILTCLIVPGIYVIGFLVVWPVVFHSLAAGGESMMPLPMRTMWATVIAAGWPYLAWLWFDKWRRKLSEPKERSPK